MTKRQKKIIKQIESTEKTNLERLKELTEKLSKLFREEEKLDLNKSNYDSTEKLD